MKIAIIGYSGAGKSTLAQALGEQLHIPILYLDQVHFLPGWQERPDADACALVEAFLTGENWIIDGNYRSYLWDRRMAEADQILFLDLSRWRCLWRVVKRCLQNRHQTRSTMAPGCEEKLDWEFIRWVLWEGRTPQRRTQLCQLAETYPQKFLSFKNPGQVARYLASLPIEDHEQDI